MNFELKLGSQHNYLQDKPQLLIGQDSRSESSYWLKHLNLITLLYFNYSRAQEILGHDALYSVLCWHQIVSQGSFNVWITSYESQMVLFWFCWHKLCGHNRNWFLGRPGLKDTNIHHHKDIIAVLTGQPEPHTGLWLAEIWSRDLMLSSDWSTPGDNELIR